MGNGLTALQLEHNGQDLDSIAILLAEGLHPVDWNPRRRVVLQDLLRNAPIPLDFRIRKEEMPHSGMLAKSGDSYYIAVNAGHPRGRQRFSIAHELGHSVVMPYEPEESSAAFRNAALHTDRQEEHFCDRFAAELLMPRRAITPILESVPLTPQLIRTIAQQYDVSIHAASRRVAELTSIAIVLGMVQERPSTVGPIPTVVWSTQSNPVTRRHGIGQVRLLTGASETRMRQGVLDIRFRDKVRITAIPEQGVVHQKSWLFVIAQTASECRHIALVG